MRLSALLFPICVLAGYLDQWYGEQDLYMSCWGKEAVVGYIFGAVPIFATYLTLIAYQQNLVIYLCLSSENTQFERIVGIFRRSHDATDETTILGCSV